jgi:hypothetical protein
MEQDRWKPWRTRALIAFAVVILAFIASDFARTMGWIAPA